MSYFETSEQLIDYWYDALNDSNLGLEFVGYAEERLIPRYPAVVLGDVTTAREIHATQQFLLVFTMSFFIYHAKLSQSHRVRTREDLKLVTRVRDFFHTDHNCKLRRDNDPGVVFGWITDEAPGLIQRRNESVVGTRMGWEGQAIVRF